MFIQGNFNFWHRWTNAFLDCTTAIAISCSDGSDNLSNFFGWEEISRNLELFNFPQDTILQVREILLSLILLPSFFPECSCKGQHFKFWRQPEHLSGLRFFIARRPKSEPIHRPVSSQEVSLV